MSPSPRRVSRDPVALVRILLVTLAFVTPAVFDLGAVKPFDLVKAVTVWFFGWLAFGVWFGAAVSGHTRPRRFLMAYLAGVYLLATAVATLGSETKWTSLLGWYGRHTGMVTILVFVLVFYVVACTYHRRRDRAHELIYAMGAGALVLTAYILVQWIGIDPVAWQQPTGEVPGQPYFGTMGNANFAGGYLGLTSPWLYLAFRSSRRRRLRVTVAAAGAAELWALWLTSARNGMFALAAAAVILLIVHRRRVPLPVKLGAAVAFLVACVLTVLIVWHPGSDRPPEPLRDVNVLRSETIRVRYYWWTGGIKMFADRPLFGFGPDTFVVQNPKYLPRHGAQLANAETADKPHNVFVEHAAQTGIVGLGSYLALLAVAFRRGFRRLRDARGEDRLVVETLLALLAAYVGQAFFSMDVIAIGVSGWIVLGLMAAIADPPSGDGEDRPERRPSSVGRLPAVASVVLLGMFPAALSTAPLKADHESKTALRMAAANDFVDEVLAHHDRSRRWHPLEPIYHGSTGDYLERQASVAEDRDRRRELLEQAVDRYRRMDELQPGYNLWKMTIGKGVALLASSGGDASFTEAQEWVDEAVRIAPNDWRGLVTRGDLLNLWSGVTSDPERETELLCGALADYEAGAELRPKTFAAWLGVGRTLVKLGRVAEAIRPLKRAVRLNEDSELGRRALREAREALGAGGRPAPARCP